ncbi:hypothetical protein N7527_003488 [Penicillium freii]|nr:hypothetical protein N7527_003488 [Penicillium freii]
MSSSPSSFAEPKLPQLVPILTGKFYSSAVSTLGILTFLRSSRADTMKSDNPIFWGEPLGLLRPEEAEKEYMELRKDLQSIRYTAI